jgi:hypothetical protein
VTGCWDVVAGSGNGQARFGRDGDVEGHGCHARVCTSDMQEALTTAVCMPAAQAAGEALGSR